MPRKECPDCLRYNNEGDACPVCWHFSKNDKATRGFEMLFRENWADCCIDDDGTVTTGAARLLKAINDLLD